MLLSDTEVAHYEREGWLAPRPRLSPERVAELVRFSDELAAAPAQRGGPMKYIDDAVRESGGDQLGRIEYFQHSHAGLRAFTHSELALGLVEQLFGEPALLFKDKVNYKLPGGAPFEPHQDIQAGWSKYCGSHLTLVVHLDAATPENGCLEVARGAPRHQLLGESWRPLEGDGLRGLEFVPCPAEPGELLCFDSYVPHRSASNRSASPRRVLYLTYNPRSQGDHYERYFADKRAAYPPDAEREPGRTYRYRV